MISTLCVWCTVNITQMLYHKLFKSSLANQLLLLILMKIKCPLMYDARDALELICGQPARNVVFPVIEQIKQETGFYVFPYINSLKLPQK